MNKEEILKRYKNMTNEKKQAKKEYKKNCYKKLKAYKDELLLEKSKNKKRKWLIFARKKNISEKT